MQAETRKQQEQIEKPEDPKARIEENKAKPRPAWLDDSVIKNYLMLKSAVGGEDNLAHHIIGKSGSIAPLADCHEFLKLGLASLAEQKPKDATEARLCAQAATLFSLGISNLERAEKAGSTSHTDHYSNIAVKLLRLHNETIEALSRYRRGGEQKVTVVHVAEKMAVVNNYGGGGNTKNEGASPCSKNAEQKQELQAISHVECPQWPTEGVDCTAGKAPALRQKKAVNA